jgi:hypothetical protein
LKRHAFDLLAGLIGLGLAAVLLIAGGLLTWANTFVGDQVHDQLAAQQIYFPKAGTEGLTELKGADFDAINKYAGQQLTTGDQAEAYADHFIAVHLNGIGGGQTYAQLSAQAIANPDDQALAGKVATMFKGETLRGLLLNAYAFGKMGTIAGIAAIFAYAFGGLLAILGGLGLWHARRATEKDEILAPHAPKGRTPVTV